MNTNYSLDELLQLQNPKDTAPKIDKLLFVCLLVVIGFIPLILLASMQTVQSPVISNISYLKSGRFGDLFGYYKVHALVFMTVLCVILLCIRTFKYNIALRSTKLNWLVASGILMILISTFLSSATTIALTGHYTRVEGALTWLCYLTLFFIAYNIELPKNMLRMIVYTLTPFIIINFYIIVRYFYGDPLFNTSAFLKIATMMIDGSINRNAAVVGTLNQWNNMSGMFAILTVLLIAVTIFETSNRYAAFTYTLAIISVAVLLMSISTAGFLNMLMMFVALVAFAWRYGNLKRGLWIIGSFIFVMLPIIHILSSENPRVFRESLGFIIKENPYVGTISSDVESPEEMGRYEMKNELFQTPRAQASDEVAYALPVLPERGNAALTSRVYIWDKTIEMLKDKPVFGFGMDTFAYYFPHYNIDARAGMFDEKPIVTKAHSTYFGLLQGLGYVGFIPFALLFVSFVIIVAMSFFKKREEKDIPFIILGLAFMAYMIQAIVNDSVPGISSPLWVMIGLSMGALAISNKQNTEEQSFN